MTFCLGLHIKPRNPHRWGTPNPHMHPSESSKGTWCHASHPLTLMMVLPLVVVPQQVGVPRLVLVQPASMKLEGAHPAQTDYQQWPCPFHPPSSPRRHSSGMVAMGSRECACLAALSQGGSKHCLQRSSVCHPAGSPRNCRREHGATENPECVDLVQWSPDGWWRCQPCSLACRQASSLSWRKVQHYISN